MKTVHQHCLCFELLMYVITKGCLHKRHPAIYIHTINIASTCASLEQLLWIDILYNAFMNQHKCILRSRCHHLNKQQYTWYYSSNRLHRILLNMTKISHLSWYTDSQIWTCCLWATLECRLTGLWLTANDSLC